MDREASAALEGRMTPGARSAPRLPTALAVLGLLAVPILFAGLGAYPVVNADEAFYHDVARTMLESGDWWRVRTGSSEHVYDTFANAPLQYWARGLVISWVGPGPFGMRIGSALAGLLAVWATCVLATRLAGSHAGLLAGGLLLTTYQFVWLHGARTGELDAGVALLLVLLAGLFVRALVRPGAGFLLHHLCLAALFGWKAPVVSIPLLAEALCFALLPAARPRLGAWLRAGVLVLPLALVWHGWQAWRLRAWLPEVVAAVGAQAGGGAGIAPGAGPAGRALWYGERMLFGAWPHIVLLPAALAALGPALGDAGRRAGPVTARSLGVAVTCAYTAAVLGFYVAISKVGPW